MAYGTILTINPGSLAEELELVPGDKIIEVNGMKLRDIIDLSFAFADEEIEMLVEHEDGQQEVYEFDKDYDEELGVEFESAVFDGIRHCANNCLFCFVDQVAPDMRESLNIKDDDYRMSFLYGNFITMTNMVDADFQRIKQYHLSPLFVSVQCTNPDLRQKLLRCRTAGNLSVPVPDERPLRRSRLRSDDSHFFAPLCAGRVPCRRRKHRCRRLRRRGNGSNDAAHHNPAAWAYLSIQEKTLQSASRAVRQVSARHTGRRHYRALT